MNREIKTLGDLTPDSKNARKHNPRNIDMIAKSIGEVGVGRSIVIDENGVILAGNGTVEALAECGIENVRVIKANGNELIAVQRSDLTEDQKKKLALFDNRTAELAEWDIDVLKDIQLDSPELLEGMFSELELEGLFELDDMPIGSMDGEDDAPEPPAIPVTQLGELYQLGEHRLLCGDSTDKETVDRLMDGHKADMVFTDPPYGMCLDTDWSGAKSNLDFAKAKGVLGGKKHRQVIGDHADFSPDLISCILALGVKETFIWGADYFAELLPDKNDGSWVVWDKRLDESADKMYGSCFELCWSRQKHKREIARIKWAGIFGTEKELDRKRHHPTQKPMLLVEWFLTKWGSELDVVIDLFGGSGSTMIASEKLNRKCYMMELDPQYCDVIIERYKNLFPEKEVKKLSSGVKV